MTKEQSAVANSSVETEEENKKKNRSTKKRESKESSAKSPATAVEAEAKPAPKRKRSAKAENKDVPDPDESTAESQSEAKSTRSRKTKSQAIQDDAPKAAKPRTRSAKSRTAASSAERSETKTGLDAAAQTVAADTPKRASQTKKTRSSKKAQASATEPDQASLAPQALEKTEEADAEPKTKRPARSRSVKKNARAAQEPLPEVPAAEKTPIKPEKAKEPPLAQASPESFDGSDHTPEEPKPEEQREKPAFETVDVEDSSLAKLVIPAGRVMGVQTVQESQTRPEEALQRATQAEQEDASKVPSETKQAEELKTGAPDLAPATVPEVQAPSQVEQPEEGSERHGESGRVSRRHHRGRRRPQSRVGAQIRSQAEGEQKEPLSEEEQSLELSEARQKETPEVQSEDTSDRTVLETPELSETEAFSDAEFWDADDEGDEAESKGRSRRKEAQLQPRKLNRKMFFSVLAGECVEVALSAEGKLCEYYLDMQHQKKLKGNIYKGIIQNIDTNLQAAFVNYGTQKNGFLQIDEIHSEYWLSHYEPTKGNKFPPIQKVIKPGQEVLVQVVKEPTGNKGAFLTTWLSLAGRFLVLTPGQDQIGVSRKVVDEAERARLKDLINGIDPGEDIGVIVRTVSAGTTKTTLKNDLQYLKRIWREIRKKGTELEAPCLIYTEPSLVERAVRDYLTEDVTEIWADDEKVAETVRNMVNLLFPRKKDLVHLFVDKKQSLWDRFNLRRQIEQVYSREVFLPSGGRLVFDQTEALMAVDVNSGKISCKGSFETMAYRTNMEAAESIARQLRLRDVGGQVVIDFIEMRDKKHVEDVERNLRLAMKSDKARYDIEHMSSFGLLELVRQRTGFSALSITQEPCPNCAGTGQRRNLEWQSLQVASDIQRQMRLSKAPVCVYETSAELGMYLLNHKREMLQELEQEYGKKLEIAIRHNS